MSISKKDREFTGIKAIMNNIVLSTACEMQNGSITIIKQDNTIIQVNINEKIDLSSQADAGNIVEEAVI